MRDRLAQFEQRSLTVLIPFTTTLLFWSTLGCERVHETPEPLAEDHRADQRKGYLDVARDPSIFFPRKLFVL